MTDIIYDWGTRPDFLLPRLYPAAKMVSANPFADEERLTELVADYATPECNLFFHLNISRSENWFPDRERVVAKLMAAGFGVINHRISNICKSNLQRLNRELGLRHVSLERDDDADTLVIVKTDYNYGGIGESRLSPEEAERLKLQSMAGCSIGAFDEYYRCRLGEVSPEVWLDERLVVERYIENEANILYRFYRCGGRAVLSRVINDKVIKKMIPGLPRKNWLFQFGDDCPDVPPDLVSNAVKVCEATGLQFGTLDIVVDDQSLSYVVDINPTPGWGAEKQDVILDHLREGF